MLDLSGESFPYSSVDVEGSSSAAGAHQAAPVTLSATHTAWLHYTLLQWVPISHPANLTENSIGIFSLKVISLVPTQRRPTSGYILFKCNASDSI